MKTIEEKARAYDEAIERARKIKNGEPINVPDGTPIPIAIFPELKESEDEKIREELIEFVDTNTLSIDERHDRWIAYLKSKVYKTSLGVKKM